MNRPNRDLGPGSKLHDTRGPRIATSLHIKTATRWLTASTFAASLLTSISALAQTAMPPAPLYPTDPARPLHY
jgi:hypothetical protein